MLQSAICCATLQQPTTDVQLVASSTVVQQKIQQVDRLSSVLPSKGTHKYNIINCVQGEHIPTRGRFFADINPMTLKLEGDLDILKMYLYTENEVAVLRHSKLLTVYEISTVHEKIT